MGWLIGQLWLLLLLSFLGGSVLTWLVARFMLPQRGRSRGRHRSRFGGTALMGWLLGQTWLWMLLTALLGVVITILLTIRKLEIVTVRERTAPPAREPGPPASEAPAPSRPEPEPPETRAERVRAGPDEPDVAPEVEPEPEPARRPDESAPRSPGSTPGRPRPRTTGRPRRATRSRATTARGSTTPPSRPTTAGSGLRCGSTARTAPGPRDSTRGDGATLRRGRGTEGRAAARAGAGPSGSRPANEEFSRSEVRRTALEDGSRSGGFRVKGNADTMLFHTEESPYYGRTRAEVWFSSEEAARAAGFARWGRGLRSAVS